MPKISRKEVARSVGRTRDDINNWHRSGVTEYSPENGIYTNRRALLELAFVSAQVAVGVPPRDAGPMARRWLSENERGKMTPLYARNGLTGRSLEFSDREMNHVDLGCALADDIPGGFKAGNTDGDDTDIASAVASAVAVSVVDRKAIVDRVNALCEAA